MFIRLVCRIEKEYENETAAQWTWTGCQACRGGRTAAFVVGGLLVIRLSYIQFDLWQSVGDRHIATIVRCPWLNPSPGSYWDWQSSRFAGSGSASWAPGSRWRPWVGFSSRWSTASSVSPTRGPHPSPTWRSPSRSPPSWSWPSQSSLAWHLRRRRGEPVPPLPLLHRPACSKSGLRPRPLHRGRSPALLATNRVIGLDRVMSEVRRRDWVFRLWYPQTSFVMMAGEAMAQVAL